MNDVTAGIFLIVISMFIIAFAVVLVGAKDVHVNRKNTEYNLKRSNDYQRKFLASLADDDLDSHAADNPDMKFYQKS